MAGSVNKVILIGRLGFDPEIHSTQAGKEICNLRVATSESWRDKATGEKKESVQWHRVVIFNENLVNLAKNYLKKGSSLYLEGSLQTRKWTDKDGLEKYSTEVVLQNFNGTIVLLGGKPQEGESVPSAHEQAKQNGYQSDPEFNDDIPF